jgi:hypothetical protein
MTTVALAVASVTSAGGLTALVVKKLRGKVRGGSIGIKGDRNESPKSRAKR